MRTFVKASIASTALFAALFAAAQPAPMGSANSAPAATAAAPGAPAAGAESEFAKKHPRIHEVNQRLRNERARIQADLAAGKITKPEAKQLMQKAHQIHKQEMQDAMKNEGHLTKAEQEHLNREENKLSGEIHEEAHNGAAAPAGK